MGLKDPYPSTSRRDLRKEAGRKEAFRFQTPPKPVPCTTAPAAQPPNVTFVELVAEELDRQREAHMLYPASAGEFGLVSVANEVTGGGGATVHDGACLFCPNRVQARYDHSGWVYILHDGYDFARDHNRSLDKNAFYFLPGVYLACPSCGWMAEIDSRGGKLGQAYATAKRHIGETA